MGEPRQPRQRAHHVHHNHVLVHDMVVIEYVLIPLKIPQRRSKGDVTNSVEAEELRLLGQIEWSRLVMGGQIFPFEQIHESENLSINTWFEAKIAIVLACKLCPVCNNSVSGLP